MLDALQKLVDNGLSDKTVGIVVADLLENNEFEDDDNKRYCVAYDWYRSQGNKRDPSDIDPSDVEPLSDDTICIDGAEYLVLTDDEATAACRERIVDTIWAFNADFLSGETGIDSTVFEALADKCEGANDAVMSIINGTCGFDDFYNSVVSADGRGHFLSGYDGEENERYVGENEYYYLYRIN